MDSISDHGLKELEETSVDSDLSEVTPQIKTCTDKLSPTNDTDANLSISCIDAAPTAVDNPTQDVSENLPVIPKPDLKADSSLPDATLINCEDVKKAEPLQTVESTSANLSHNKKRKWKGEGQSSVKRRNVSKEIKLPEVIADEGKRVMLPRRVGIDWKPGTRLEAMDFLKNCCHWYPSKIVAINQLDMKVLIHFDRWNSKFDQWIDMKSDRLRPLVSAKGSSGQHSAKLQGGKDLKVGQIVLAKWLNSKYPAKIKEQRSQGRLTIEFYDGVEMQTDQMSVQALAGDLQAEALYIWETMKELADTSENLDSTLSNSSRRVSLEVNRIQQTKMEKAEARLIQLIHKASSKPEAEHSVSDQPKTVSTQAVLTTDSAHVPDEPKSSDSRPSSRNTDTISVISGDGILSPNCRLKLVDGIHLNDLILVKDQSGKPIDQLAVVQRLLYKKRLTIKLCDGSERTVSTSNVQRLHNERQTEALKLWQQMMKLREDNSEQKQVCRSSVNSEIVSRLASLEQLLTTLMQEPGVSDRSSPASKNSQVRSRGSSFSGEKKLNADVDVKLSLRAERKSPLLKSTNPNTEIIKGKALKMGITKWKSPKVSKAILVRGKSTQRDKNEEQHLQEVPEHCMSDKFVIDKKKPLKSKIGRKPTKTKTGKKKAIKSKSDTRKNIAKTVTTKVRTMKGRSTLARLKKPAAKFRKTMKDLSDVDRTKRSAGKSHHKQREAIKSDKVKTLKSSCDKQVVSHGSNFKSARSVNQQRKCTKDKRKPQKLDPICSGTVTKHGSSEVKKRADESAELKVVKSKIIGGKHRHPASPLYAVNKEKNIQLNRLKNNQRLLLKRKAVRHKSAAAKASKQLFIKMPAGRLVKRQKNIHTLGSERVLSTPSKLSSKLSVVLTPTSKATIDAHRRLDLGKVEPESLPQSASEEDTLPLDESLDSSVLHLSTDCDEEDETVNDTAMAELDGWPAQCKEHVSVKLSPLQLSRLLVKKPTKGRSSRSKVRVKLKSDAGRRHRSESTKLSVDSQTPSSNASDQKPEKTLKKAGKATNRRMKKAVVNLQKASVSAGASGSSRSSTRVADLELARKAAENSKNMRVGYAVILEPTNAKPSKAFTVDDDQNQYKCHHCQKCFRKATLLASHIKYNHNLESKVAQTAQRARKARSKSSNTFSIEKDVAVPQPSALIDSAGASHDIADDNVLPDLPLQSAAYVALRPSDVTTVPTRKLSTTSTPLASPTSSINAVRSPQVVAQAKVGETDDCDSESVPDSDYQTEVVNCVCGFNEEDSLMIQCEFCCCWQHSECFGIHPKTLPDRYLCFVCVDTPGVRESSRFLYNHNWRKRGLLPKLDGKAVTAEEHKAAEIMRRSQQERIKLQDQLEALKSIKRLLDSTAKSDAYELALWSPEEELSPVGLDSCPTNEIEKENLLRRVQQIHNDMGKSLEIVKSTVTALETEAGINPLSIDEDVISTNKSLNALVHDMTKVDLLNRLTSTSRTPDAACTENMPALITSMH